MFHFLMENSKLYSTSILISKFRSKKDLYAVMKQQVSQNRKLIIFIIHFILLSNKRCRINFRKDVLAC